MIRSTLCRPIALISRKASPARAAGRSISPSSVPISVGEKPMRRPAKFSGSAAREDGCARSCRAETGPSAAGLEIEPALTFPHRGNGEERDQDDAVDGSEGNL